VKERRGTNVESCPLKRGHFLRHSKEHPPRASWVERAAKEGKNKRWSQRRSIGLVKVQKGKKIRIGKDRVSLFKVTGFLLGRV